MEPIRALAVGEYDFSGAFFPRSTATLFDTGVTTDNKVDEAMRERVREAVETLWGVGLLSTFEGKDTFDFAVHYDGGDGTVAVAQLNP